MLGANKRGFVRLLKVKDRSVLMDEILNRQRDPWLDLEIAQLTVAESRKAKQ